jgi:hypothetical protein
MTVEELKRALDWNGIQEDTRIVLLNAGDQQDFALTFSKENNTVTIEVVYDIEDEESWFTE